jgi:hypothetical protein
MGGGGMFGTQGSQAVTQTDVDRYQKLLGLSEAQKESFKKAFNAYTGQYQAEEAAMQEKVDRIREEAQDTGDFTVMRNITAPTQEFRASATKMEEKADEGPSQGPDRGAEGQLGQAGDGRGAVTRRPRGMMVASAERIDLVKIVDDMRNAGRDQRSLSPTLDQYETELDKELLNRGKVNDEVTASMTEMRNNMGANRNQGGGGAGGGQGGAGGFQQMMEKMRPVIDKARDASSKVQEVNRRYAAKVQSLLPGGSAPGVCKGREGSEVPGCVP